MQEILTVFAAFLLCAGLLAGCASGSGTAGSAASAAPSAAAVAQAPEETPAPEGTVLPEGAASSAPEPGAESTDDAPEGYSVDALNTALDGCVAFEADSAGGSLKTAIAAAGLVDFLANECTPNDAVTLMADGVDWYASLTESERSALALNWPQIESTARAIAEDPAAQAELLSSAGVETDFSAMDLSGVGQLLDTLHEIFSGPAAARTN